MSGTETTSWRVIQGAAEGTKDLREEFARRYGPLMEAYFGARWRGSALSADVGDAVQEAFVECLRPDGVLQSAQRDRPGGFRAYLFGVLRNVALRVEQRRSRDDRVGLESGSAFKVIADPHDPASVVFDREWARTLMREAAERHAQVAGQDEAALRRVELLRMRFQDRLPIRDIARRWGVEVEIAHREYGKARREFETALRAVVAEHHPGTQAQIELTLREIIRSLGQ